jgi:uncharacterized protein (DUF1501 family)
MKRAQDDRDPRSARGLTRRALLGHTATLTAATALSGTARGAAGGGAKPVLVQVYLRGGMDALTMFPPYGDGDLYVQRPRLAIRPPGAPAGAIDLDGFFGLAPAAAPLLTPYAAGHLVVVHATGSIDPTRSHFQAYERMEGGDFTRPYGPVASGWGARYLGATAAAATYDLRGISVATGLPQTLYGSPKTLPIANFADFSFPGLAVSALQRQAAIVDAYSRRRPAVGLPAIQTIDLFGLGGVDFVGYVPANGAQYPASLFGTRMRRIAALLKAELGVEMLSLDYNGWDLHAELGPRDGLMAEMMDDLTRGLEAFYLDMLGNLDDYVLVCLSEFGRHVRENGSHGVDHGHGGALFVMGGNVAGGRVIADWPGLSGLDLDQGDLAITIDYRDVLGEVLIERLGVTDLAPIFPGHAYRSQGVTA